MNAPLAARRDIQPCSPERTRAQRLRYLGTAVGYSRTVALRHLRFANCPHDAASPSKP
jgi:hypothetical protein